MYRLAAIAVAFVLLPSGLDAQMRTLDRFQRTVNQELRRYEEVFEVEDMTHEVWFGEMDDEGTRTLRVPLEAGAEYLILAVCDEDCDDLDLRLSLGGDLIDEDLALDDYPVVTVQPTRSTDYELEVRMVSCSADPCRYGVAVYAN